MSRRITNLLSGLLCLLAPVGLLAHHSVAAEFDLSKPVTFTGTITRIDWMNPHIYTHVAVTQSDGKKLEYQVEGNPPNALFRQGWRKDSLKVGETVTVTGNRAKSETSMHVGQATITTADGKKVFTGRAPGSEAASP
jgi:Family of unknown function (DUF6152)